jgi:hypothetical protein
MPLARYFLYVGGVLLTLLLVANAGLPKPPPVVETAAYLPPIRIHSDRKWPERIVFDTSAPMVRVAQATDSVVVNPPAPPPPAGVLPPDLREALARMQPSDVSPPRSAKQAKPAPKPQRRLARNHSARPVLLAERRTQSGWFSQTVW